MFFKNKIAYLNLPFLYDYIEEKLHILQISHIDRCEQSLDYHIWGIYYPFLKLFYNNFPYYTRSIKQEFKIYA